MTTKNIPLNHIQHFLSSWNERKLSCALDVTIHVILLSVTISGMLIRMNCLNTNHSLRKVIFIILFNQFLCVTARSATRILAIVILSICWSVGLSVKTRYRFKLRWDKDSRFLPYVSVVSSLFWPNFVPLGEETPLERRHQRGVPTKKYLTTVSSSSVKTVADRHRLAAYHNKYYWRPFWRYQHWWPWTTLTPKIWFSVNFLRFQTHFKSELHQHYWR